LVAEPVPSDRGRADPERVRQASLTRHALAASYSPGVDVDWNDEVVDQLESHWRHQLRPRLSGLTDDEYFWRPVPDCWTISARGVSRAPVSLGAGEFTLDFGEPVDDREPMTTIAWRLGHLIVGFADAPMARLILYTNLEVIHHGAEICLLRDLYLRRAS
jgi:hypothetical protein